MFAASYALRSFASFLQMSKIAARVSCKSLRILKNRDVGTIETIAAFGRLAAMKLTTISMMTHNIAKN